MKFFRQFIFVVGACFMFLSMASCHGHHFCANAATLAEKKPLRIVASVFPIYIFTANICNGLDDVQLEMLVPASVGCPHDFAPTPADMQKLARADIVVINGLGLESFLSKTLKNVAPHAKVIDASQNLQPVNSHGMINPHTFAAPGQAAVMAGNIAAELATIDKVNARHYLNSANAYMTKLEDLDTQLKKIGLKAKNPKIVLEHDALEYLAHDADLKVVAVIDQHASASYLAKLGKLLEQDKPALLAGDAQYSDRLLKTLAGETGIPFARLDSCSGGPANPPLDFYETVMKKNIKDLEKYFD